MALIQQILILLVMLVSGLAFSATLFWVLFKKGAPTYDEVRERFLMD